MKKINYKTLISILFLIIVSLLNYLLLNICYKPKVIIGLIGNDLEEINIHSDFIDKGISIIEDGIEIKDYEVKYHDNIDKDHVGSYEANYDIKYKDKNYILKRNINVLDKEEPNIITNDIVYGYTCNGTVKNNLDYIAIDNYDGVITDKVQVNYENDKVILSVTDLSNNNAVKEVEYKLIGVIPAIIKLNGTDIIYIKKDSEYKEPGITITDGCGKKINNPYVVEGVIDTSIPGIYELKYITTYNDITTYKTRRVIVYEGYDSEPIEYNNEEKVVYLTFDDGPGSLTEDFLKVLDKYNVKATFFVTSQFPKYNYLINKEKEAGHEVAVHTYTHKYNVYSSKENYVRDLELMNNVIEKETGSKSYLFRFPGGSSNTISKSYSKGIVRYLSNELQRDGYVYFDWNVDSGDAAGKDAKTIAKNVINGVHSHKVSVVLCHDIQKNTLEALPEILDTLTKEGYEFRTLNKDSFNAHHGINN